MTETRRGPGRRPGGVDTRGEVLAAARTEFGTKGFDGASVRGIARLAGVDAALVHHYFGTKEQLFVAAMQFPIDPSTEVPALFAGGRDGLGGRVVRLFLSVYEDPVRRDPVLGMLRSAMTSEPAAAMLREFITRAIVRRVAGGLDVPGAELRAALAASHLLGLAIARYVVRIEPLASATADELVALVGPTVQRYLTEPPPAAP